MRPVLVTAILLLVVLMFTSDSEAWTPEEMCRTKYPAKPCRDDYFAYTGWYQMGENRCVKAFFNSQHKGFFDAERACTMYWNNKGNGHLVSIHSIVELCQVECAMYRVNTGAHPYWIGLRLMLDDNGRTTLGWIDETKYVFSHFARGQPDYYGYREECIEMNHGGWGLWNDNICDQKRPYVCAINV